MVQHEDGVAELVKELATDIIAMQSIVDAKNVAFDDAATCLELRLDHLLHVMGEIDWNKSDTQLPEGAIRLASRRFG